MAEQMKNKRVKFLKGKQGLFIDSVVKRLNVGRDKLSEIFNIDKRTLSDWCREKSTMSYKALLDLCKNYNISVPKGIRVLPQFWYVNKAAKLGGLIRNKLYGNFGTLEGRIKGGLATIKKFTQKPELANKLGLKIIKDIKRPKSGLQLAEFIGIVLGNGGLTDYQLKVSFNRDTDADHGNFVKELVGELFGLTSKIIHKKFGKGSDVTVYSRNLVKFLESNGLRKGNKVKNKADIPLWIKRNNKLQLSCLRGLMDTDGSCYSYSHSVNKKRYCNVALCFTNASKALLKSVYNIFNKNGYYPCITGRRVYIYKENEVIRYFQEIGTHNSKHLKNFKRFRLLKD
jgi:hypothetical protein